MFNISHSMIIDAEILYDELFKRHIHGTVDDLTEYALTDMKKYNFTTAEIFKRTYNNEGKIYTDYDDVYVAIDYENAE